MKYYLQRAFSLVELSIVIFIISILSAIALPQYQNFVARAQSSEMVVLTQPIRLAAVEYYQLHNSLVGFDTRLTGYTTQGKYVSSISVVIQGNAQLVVTVLFTKNRIQFKAQDVVW